MTRLRLYALVPPGGPPPGAGAQGEPLERVTLAEGVAALVGPAGDGPVEATADALQAHDAAVRRLAGAAEGLLPARFGQVVDDEAALRSWAGPRAAAIREALAAVAGCEQMTLRLWSTGAPAPAFEEPPPGAGPGTRWLLRRLAEARLPEADPLRAALGPDLVRDERVARARAAPLLGSLYHLVRREDVAAYREAVARAAAGQPAVRVAVTGPWPPYAFAAPLEPEPVEEAST